MLGEQLDQVRLSDLTAGDVQAALVTPPSPMSALTARIPSDMRVRAIHGEEQDDLVARHFAPLVKPPRKAWRAIAEGSG
jgi:hypothetical protein